MAGKRALITGITGQDGSYLAEFLLEKGYEVHGMVRRSSTETFQRLAGFRDNVVLHTGDLLDQRSLVDVLREAEPDEIYNLAAMSFVAASWSQPVLTAEFTAVGVTRILEAMREVVPQARFYQASSSEMFGQVREVPRPRRRPSTPARPTAWRSATATSSPSTTARATGCSPLRDPLQPRVRAARAGVRHPQGHPRRAAASSSACRRSSRSGTSTRSATGATPRTTSRRCG